MQIVCLYVCVCVIQEHFNHYDDTSLHFFSREKTNKQTKTSLNAWTAFDLAFCAINAVNACLRQHINFRIVECPTPTLDPPHTHARCLQS